MIKAAAVARENIRKCVVGTLADMNATQVGVALRRVLEGDTSTAHMCLCSNRVLLHDRRSWWIGTSHGSQRV